jgi:hypothetical protein
MAEISPLLAVIIVILWPLLTAFVTWKYIRAFKEKKRLDKWIWFLTWCWCISAIEWWVLSLMLITKTVR